MFSLIETKGPWGHGGSMGAWGPKRPWGDHGGTKGFGAPLVPRVPGGPGVPGPQRFQDIRPIFT